MVSEDFLKVGPKAIFLFLVMRFPETGMSLMTLTH
jgi:hypothetical protein